MMGSLVGQAIAFLVLPLITRVYNVEVLGQAAAVLALVSIVSIILFLQYDQAVIVAADKDVPYLLLLSCLIAISLVAVMSALILADQSGIFARDSALLPKWNINLTFPLLLLTYGSYVLFTNLSLRENRLDRVSGGRVIYYGGGAILQLVAGALLGGKVNVYLMAQVAASIAAALYLVPYRTAYYWIRHRQQGEDTFAGILTAARRYRKFPQYQIGAGLVTAGSIYMPTIFLRVSFGDAWAGWYFLAWRMVAAPATLLAQAVGQVFYRDSAERERKSARQDRVLEQTATGLLHLSVIPAVAAGIMAPLLVTFIFGEDWYPVAIFIQLLLVGAVIGLFTSPLSTFLNVKGLQAQDLIYKSVLFVARLLGLTAGLFVESAFVSILAYSFATATVTLFYFRFILRSGGGSAKSIFRKAAPLIVDSLLVLLLAAILGLKGILYEPIGMLVTLLAIVIAAWRDIGRWRKQEATTVILSLAILLSVAPLFLSA